MSLPTSQEFLLIISWQFILLHTNIHIHPKIQNKKCSRLMYHILILLSHILYLEFDFSYIDEQTCELPQGGIAYQPRVLF